MAPTTPTVVRDLPAAFVALAILLYPISPLFATVAFGIGAFAGGMLGWPVDDRARSRRLVIHIVILLVLSTWLVIRVEPPWGSGTHQIWRSSAYPVNLLDYLPFLWAFLLLSWHRVSVRGMRLVCWALIVAAIAYGVLVYGQMYRGWNWIWYRDIGTFRFLESVLQVWRPGRASGGFLNPNLLALSSLYSLIAAGTLTWTERARRGDHPALRTVRVLAALTGGAASLWTLYHAGSRITWAAVVLVLLVAAVRFPRAAQIAALNLVVIGGAVLLLAVRDYGPATDTARQVVPEIVWGRIVGTEDIRTSRLSYRTWVWGCGVELIREHPIAGTGLGTFGPECEARLSAEMGRDVRPTTINHAHNLPIQVAAELGLPFAMAVFAWIGWLLWWAVTGLGRDPTDREDRQLRLGFLLLILGTLVVSQVNLVLAHDFRLAVPFWAAMAFVVSPLAAGRRRHGQEPEGPGPVDAEGVVPKLAAQPRPTPW